MTAIEKISSYLDRSQGRAFCDDCISKSLKILPRQAVQQKTFKLAKSPLFERKVLTCAACKATGKLCITKSMR
jgi:hypothetical protein